MATCTFLSLLFLAPPTSLWFLIALEASLFESLHIAAVQCLTGHVDALTSNRLAELSPDCAKYVQASLLQALQETASLQDSEQHKAQVRRHTACELSIFSPSKEHIFK